MKINISKVINYFFSSEKYEKEVEDAYCDFFGDDYEFDYKEDPKPFFTEWFIFDYKLKCGLTPLELFCEKNFCDLPAAEMLRFKSFLDNEYGIFEVLEINIGQNMLLKNIVHNNEYRVKEYMATFNLQIGSTFFARISEFNGGYSMIGANSIVFLKEVMDAGLRDYLICEYEKEELSPRIVLDFLAKNKDESSKKDDAFGVEKLILDESVLEKKIVKLLKKLKLDEFVSITSIRAWVVRAGEDEFDPSEFFKILFGLCQGRGSFEKMEELLSLYSNLYNITPQKALNGKSPLEMKKSGDSKNVSSKLRIEKIGDWKWEGCIQEAYDFMGLHRFRSALRKYNKGFDLMLKEKAVHPEVYRFFANKGVCHFALGQVVEGERMLEKALELNPNYDFALDYLAKYKRGVFDKEMKAVQVLSEKSLNLKMRKDKAMLYFEFLKELKINFKTAKKTKSKILRGRK